MRHYREAKDGTRASSSVYLVTVVVGISDQSAATSSEYVAGECWRRSTTASARYVAEVKLRHIWNRGVVVAALVEQEALEDAPADLDHGVISVFVLPVVVHGGYAYALENRRRSHVRREGFPHVVAAVCEDQEIKTKYT